MFENFFFPFLFVGVSKRFKSADTVVSVKIGSSQSNRHANIDSGFLFPQVGMQWWWWVILDYIHVLLRRARVLPSPSQSQTAMWLIDGGRLAWYPIIKWECDNVTKSTQWANLATQHTTPGIIPKAERVFFRSSDTYRVYPEDLTFEDSKSGAAGRWISIGVSPWS